VQSRSVSEATNRIDRFYFLKPPDANDKSLIKSPQLSPHACPKANTDARGKGDRHEAKCANAFRRDFLDLS
jgi:hypothetical protein